MRFLPHPTPPPHPTDIARACWTQYAHDVITPPTRPPQRHSTSVLEKVAETEKRTKLGGVLPPAKYLEDHPTSGEFKREVSLATYKWRPSNQGLLTTYDPGDDPPTGL